MDSNVCVTQVRYLTLKKWILAVWIVVEILEAILFIVSETAETGYLSATPNIVNEEKNEVDEDLRRKEFILVIVLGSLLIAVRSLFLYSILAQRFWLCLAYAAISFVHIVIKAISSRARFHWISIALTAIIAIVSILYVMDLYVLKQDRLEALAQQNAKQQEQKKQSETVIDAVDGSNRDNNNNKNIYSTSLKYYVTLV